MYAAKFVLPLLFLLLIRNTYSYVKVCANSLINWLFASTVTIAVNPASIS